MNIESIFPAPLGIDVIEKDYSNLAKEYKFEENILTDRKISTANLHENPDWQELANDLTNCVNKYAKALDWTTDFWISTMWLNYFDPGQKIHIHNHANSCLTLVYYIDDVSPFGGTSLFKPQSGADSWSMPGQINQYTADEWRPSCSKGTVLIFPSYIKHTSRVQAEPRYTVSANLLPNVSGVEGGVSYLKLK